MNDMQCRSMFRSKLNSKMKAVAIKNVTLAKLCGVSVGQLNRWCDGSLMPTWQQFQRVLDVFGCEDSCFLGTSISESGYTRRFK